MQNKEIDTIITVLKQLNVPYKLKILGNIHKYHEYFGSEKILIRKLSYDNFVVFEKLIKYQCEQSWDELKTFTFSKENEPENWQLEENIFYKESDNDEVPY